MSNAEVRRIGIAALAFFFFESSALLSASGTGQRDSKDGGAALELPVTRVALFSSGVGYFEHSGSVAGDATVRLPFRADEVNDALKSLVLHPGEGAGAPAVSYPAKADSERALKTFGVDLSGRPGVIDLLARMRGAGLEVKRSDGGRLSGGILSVEAGRSADADSGRFRLALLCPDGVRTLYIDELESFRFTDSALDADFRRALSLIGRERDASRTALELRLPGTGSRTASFGYVVAAPVWKATYRLDLSAAVPFLQGWAVVDNATDRDWRGVELSLVSGRPVSFVQDLYAPIYIRRPMIPLAIAGAAAARTFSGGVGGTAAKEMAEAAGLDFTSPSRAEEMAAPAPPAAAKSYAPAPSERKRASSPARADSLSSEPFEAAQARSAGDQFEFTVAKPVFLDRGRSALLPLVAGEIRASRVSVYTAGMGKAVLGARLENSTGMKLPAGPITVFDDGIYAGDALLDFFPEKDSRLIAFGEDLSLTIEESASTSLETMSVNIAKGVMTFTRRRSVSKTYLVKNAGAREKKLIIEHPESSGSELFSPGEYLEKADGRYRFASEVGAGKQLSFVVVERSPARETVALASLNGESYLRYSASKEVPESVKSALAAAAALKRKSEDAARLVREAQTKKTELTADQSRIRDNLGSLGRDTVEGKKYLQRLLDSESEMDRLKDRIETARGAAQEAQAEYESFIGTLNL